MRQIAGGDLRAAADTTRQALNADPSNLLLHNLAATLLMLTGDTAGASSEWGVVLNESPADSLATYGMGLLSLSKGDRAKALDLVQLAERNGDRAVCLVAGRYIENLNGVQGAGAGLVLPDAYAASAKGLSVIASARAGDNRRALSELPEALNALKGDPFGEPAGIVMTFETGAPLRFGSAPLPAGNGLANRRARQTDKPYSGTVTLAPDETSSDAGYVVFKIDGNLASMANTRPFQLVWNTAKVSNGLHKVEIVVYDKQGSVSNRAEREVRTMNADAPAKATPETARADDIRSMLWQSLILKPSRHALVYAGAEAARAIGDTAAAQQYIEVAAGLDPDFRDTRARWRAVSGGEASPALWRGAENEPVVALTFDDGPKPGATESLLSVLQRESVLATFFVIGRHTTANPDLVRMIAQAGMQIENHSYTHPNLTMLTPQALERELLRTIASVRLASGKQMRYFRPPGGNINGDVTRVAAQWGLTPCMWTVDGEHLESGSPDKLVDFVLQRATPGAIILLHNGRPTTVQALPRIIEGLRKRGFGFVTIDQLAERKARSILRSASTDKG